MLFKNTFINYLKKSLIEKKIKKKVKILKKIKASLLLILNSNILVRLF